MTQADVAPTARLAVKLEYILGSGGI